MRTPLIFDGHNDVLTRLFNAGGLEAATSFVTGRKGHIDLAKAEKGGFGGGFFAIWVPSPDDIDARMKAMSKPHYDLPLPAPIDAADAMKVVMAQIAILNRLEDLEALKICTTVAQLRSCLKTGKMAAIMHMEGAEAIDPDFHALDVLYRAGLRSLGPVWSRPTIFGEGVCFRYPGTPDIGGGLTQAGLALVDRCNDLGIMIDLSHLNEAGFWDVARTSRHPLVATHSNAHALCPHPRNLTDGQLEAIAQSDGMVGLNFAVAFLRQDGQMRSDVPFAQMLAHIDHLIAIVGEDRIGFGSDFDGAVIPANIGDASGLPDLRQAMVDHGYGDELITKICHGNWLRVLHKTWGS
ncbi:Microsomal dipeptidase [hydrothermal vent metagenome]|uniref:Microsomal dipeptidase n=1 Tax=hydrothermal vent metagenome TaxID=652676 RepID=A0A3B0TJV0_9ZZZZ